MNPAALSIPVIRQLTTYARRDLCIVQLQDADGIVGVGQTAPFNADITANCVHRHIAPHLFGAAGTDIRAFAKTVLTREYKFSGSYLCRALAGVDTALWDLLGKRQNKPVTELLGGRLRPFPVYASSMRRDTSPEVEAASLAEACARLGTNAVKFKIGGRMSNNADASPLRTEKLLAAVRASLGAHATLLVDANGSYDAPHAMRLFPLLREHNVTHLEEPCPFFDLESTFIVAMAARKDCASIKIAGGEQDYDPQQWARMMEMRAVDIAQPDIGYCGGLSRLMAIAAQAARAGLTVVPHTPNGSLNRLFTLHAMCALPNAGPYMEYGITSDAWGTFYEPFEAISGGKLTMPAGPGWGVQIDKAFLATCQETTYRSDT